jgi:hypothetical protein
VAIFYANDFPFIVNVDINFTALRVSKAANPIKAIIVPTAFILYVLTL